MKSKRLTVGFASTLFLLVSAVAIATEKKHTYSLQSRRSPGTIDRLNAILEVGGTLNTGEKATVEPKKDSPVKMNAEASLSYAEKILTSTSPDKRPSRAIRYYDKAEATIRVGEDTFQPVLRQKRRLIAADVGGPKVLLYGIQGLLTREELDLVDLLGNTLLLDQLLPADPVAIGGSWKHSEKLLASLCGTDSVSESDAQSVLQSVNDGMAQIEMAGYVAGTVNGRSTRMQVKAKYRFDVKAERITWFTLLVKENREPGPIGPGLDVVARLQVKIVPQVACEQLDEEVLKALSLEPTAEAQRLAYESPEGGWRVAHDRRWMLISEKKNLTVLRMADEGKYLAQCSVSATTSGDGKPLALTEFQEEVRRALGKNFRQFVRAGQSTNEAQYQVYRVEVQGEVSGVPIEWVYYRLADKQGRSMVVLFTVEANMGGRFHESDRDLVYAIRFADPKVAAKPQGDSSGLVDSRRTD